MIRFLALAAGLIIADGATTAPSALHDLHLTHARLVVEGKTVVCRVRVFRDDAEIALRGFTGQAEFTLSLETRADSVFGAYVAKHLLLKADGAPLKLRVTSSGGERDPTSQDVLWYVLEGEAPRPIARLGVLNGLMFELYRDQQNLMQVLRMPANDRKTLYFVSTDPREQVI